MAGAGVGELAKKIGKSSEYVSHRMQLLKLPRDIQEKISSNSLSVSQALEIATVDPSVKGRFADEIVNSSLTIRQIRAIKSKLAGGLDDAGCKKREGSRELSIVKKSTLALKVTLSRIDDLIDDAHKAPVSRRAELIEYLMDLRRQTHSMIDSSLQCKKRYLK